MSTRPVGIPCSTSVLSNDSCSILARGDEVLAQVVPQTVRRRSCPSFGGTARVSGRPFSLSQTQVGPHLAESPIIPSEFFKCFLPLTRQFNLLSQDPWFSPAPGFHRPAP